MLILDDGVCRESRVSGKSRPSRRAAQSQIVTDGLSGVMARRLDGPVPRHNRPVMRTLPLAAVTLLAALEKYGLKRGIAALCIGGGEATAMAIEII